MVDTATPAADQRVEGLVLVADDDPTLRLLASAELARHGHTVAVAKNGEEACELFAARLPDVVLLDITMPIVDGYEACQRLRRHAHGADLPILMLTGRNDSAAISRAYEAGATDFQTKPVNWRVLCERVQYMLRAKQHADELLQLAHYDSLTGLPNRFTFRDQLQRALAVSERHREHVAVLFLDIDGFKEVNDTFGHGFGDELLRLAAERLTQSLRVSDMPAGYQPDTAASVGRFGGDEFTILVPRMPTEDAVGGMAERIHAALTRPFRLDGKEVFVSVSSGVSVYPIDGSDADTLLTHADAAMHAAKGIGRNTHSRYRESMGIQAPERMTLANGLRYALERDELRVYFQPKVDISSRHIIGAEALIRWQHAERGLLLPVEFLDLALDIGLGLSFGDWIMGAALAQSASWRTAAGRPLPVAVNLSHAQFHLDGLIERIESILTSTGVAPSSLEVEITESVIVDDPSAAASVLASLKTLGIRTAIDDFGTGQSALGALQELPVDLLKIDRSFVRGLEQHARDRALAASIVSMGHDLGMEVIAEGVETPGQLATLAALGCDEAQGFLFGRGVPADEFERLLIENGGTND